MTDLVFSFFFHYNFPYIILHTACKHLIVFNQINAESLKITIFFLFGDNAILS